MKYKIGDKVKIKTWKEMEEEYGCRCSDPGNINCEFEFTKSMEKAIEELNCNRILTIKSVYYFSYTMKEISWQWTDDMIKCLAKNKIKEIKPLSITSRFDILDIR